VNSSLLGRFADRVRPYEGKLVHRALRPRYRAATTDGSGRAAVYLTFDDGPNPAFTAKLAEVLDRADAKATFYMTATNARRHPDLVRDLDRRGHSVGSHSDTHLPGWNTAPHRVARDLLAGHREIEQIVGHPVRHFRPPYGHLDFGVLAFCAAARVRPMLWSSDPRDWEVGCNASEVVERCIPDLRPGSIVLLHDAIFDNPDAADRQHTVDAVDQLLDVVADQGLVAAAL